ncbi:unnamed protein product [Brassica rapa subsp. narinosa]
MFWDSGFFNAGKCRVLLRGELSSPVGELSGVPTSWCELGDARGSWRTRPVFLSSLLSKLGLCDGVDERELGVLSLRRLFLSRLLHPQLWGYVSFGCLSFGSFPVSVGEVLGKASSSWWLGELLSLIVECLCIQGAWTEQWFPLSRFEVPGFWSYRLAASSSDKCGLGAEVEGTGWRVAGYRQQRYFPTIDIYSVLKIAKLSDVFLRGC